MIAEKEAREMVMGEILRNWTIENDEPVILDELTIEKDFGWIFFYNSRKFIETEEFSYTILGNAPIIINKFDGSLHYTGTAYEVEHYITEYESNLQE